MTLNQVLSRFPHIALAVSGGVDSMTLAHAAHQITGGEVQVLHAVSPAVDGASTERVKQAAQEFGWALNVIEPGEFADPDYLRNPVNRCFFCKTNLYARIAAVTDAPIASGTNTDDLGDYRPGLLAARDYNVVHPFVEAGMAKVDVRRLARQLSLPDIAELPAQPCLASRVETGIAITATDLAFVERMERQLAKVLRSGTSRCRIVHDGVRIEIGTPDCDDEMRRAEIAKIARALCDADGRRLVSVTPYKRGSAFIHG